MGSVIFRHCLFFMSNQSKAYLFAIASILCWSSISTAFKLSLTHLSPDGLLLFASFSATVFLFALVVLDGSILLSSPITNLGKSLIPGLLNPFVYYLMLFEAYSRLRAQEAQALNYTWAIVLAMFSIWLLKERFKVSDFTALLVSFVGVVIISTKGKVLSLQFDDPIASVIAVLTSVVWALYWVINVKDKRSAGIKLFYNFLIGFMAICCYLLATRKPIFRNDANIIPALLGGVYVGLFEMGLTFLLWFKALHYTNNTARISNLIFVTPFVSLLFIYGLLKESIHPATVWGLGLIVLSNIIQKSKLFKMNA